MHPSDPDARLSSAAEVMLLLRLTVRVRIVRLLESRWPWWTSWRVLRARRAPQRRHWTLSYRRRSSSHRAIHPHAHTNPIHPLPTNAERTRCRMPHRIRVLIRRMRAHSLPWSALELRSRLTAKT